MRNFLRARWALVLLLAPVSVHAADVVINNGLAPPNPENVIDGADDLADDSVHVLPVGCDLADLEFSVCPEGEPTSVEVLTGGMVGVLSAYASCVVTVSDGSVAALSVGGSATMSGGVVYSIDAGGSSKVTVSGGSIGLYPSGSPGYLTARGSSSVTMTGGSVTYQLYAYDLAAVRLDGGSVRRLEAYHASTVMLGASSVEGNLEARDSSVIRISGGSVEGKLSAFDSSLVTVSGGSVGRLLAWGSSPVVTISGGSLGEVQAGGSAAVTLRGGSVAGDLEAHDASVITIRGADFAVDGLPVGFGPIATTSGRVTGTLASGEPLDNLFCHGGGECTPGIPATGTITLPEPEVFLQLPLAALSLAALVQCKRASRAGDARDWA